MVNTITASRDEGHWFDGGVEVEYWNTANKSSPGVLYHGAKKLGKF